MAQKDGESESVFKILYLNYYEKTKVFVNKIIKNEAEAANVAQDIFIKLWNIKHKLISITNISAYIFAMAKNASFDYLEKRKKEEQQLNNIKILLKEDADNEEIAENDDRSLKELLNEILQYLSKQQKTIFKKRLDGFSNQTIASEMNISQKTVENYINLGIKNIQKRYKKP